MMQRKSQVAVIATAAAMALASIAMRTLAANTAVPSHSSPPPPTHPTPSDKPVFAWWGILTQGSSGEMRVLLSPSWWWSYFLAEFEAEPAHVLVEVLCFATIAYLMLRKPAPITQDRLTKKEEEELIAEWKPEPLCPAHVHAARPRLIVDSMASRTVESTDGHTYLNFASTNFLGMTGRPEIQSACRAAIEKYGVGSCGPRGFYGTYDLHLEIESCLASFLGAEEVILYSDALASISSVIPAFAKKDDTIVVDEAVSYAIQQGCLLSRSFIHTFKHNDMDDLARVLQRLDAESKRSKHARKRSELHRRFIVVEGVSSVYGDICPLKEVLALKEKHKYRLIVDDSLAFGVLGETGRGSIEHHDTQIAGTDPDGGATPGVDILCAALDHTLASVGGFCAGNHQVVDHQRLSGAGYCFSAASPPYTVAAAIVAVKIMQKEPFASAEVRKRAHKLRKALTTVHRKLEVAGGHDSYDSAVIHLLLKAHPRGVYNADDHATLMRIAEWMQDHANVVISVPQFIPSEKVKPQASLRIVVTAQHTDADIETLVKKLNAAATHVLG